ncbi:putative protease [Sphingobium chlorophenolicum L-1]|uniref:Putative protease n=1 Tax=Sphingobium chlorophenolicum L-1 TaxID=690566 RepID=F6EU69_SPHCR|nr:M67 family metallopeptidase [Sphingobium chlorophenolicum]AEG48698.1 putative protease [Sphingobium chlorophenolicum L-1]
MRVGISRGLLEQIMSEAAADTNEVCGLLLGEPGRIDAIQPAANAASDPARRFELDPAVLIAAHRAARAGGARIVGHYHSHPGGAPVPSATDAACAVADGSLWLIAGRGAARLWVSAGEDENARFVEASLVIL